MPDPVPVLNAALAASPISLFYSYAHEDQALRDELAGHLKILERRGLIQAWHDRQITPGQAWDQAIDQHLEQADLVLLLVSKDFIESDYIFGVELARAMQRQQARACEVVPIIVRAVNLEPEDAQDLPFLQLQALPDDLKAVTSWANRDEAWTQVAKGLRATVNGIRARRLAAPPPTRPQPDARPPRARNSMSLRQGAALPRPGAGPVPADPQLDALLRGVVSQVDQAQQQRGGAPLLAKHRDAVEQQAQSLIDQAAPMRVLWVDDHPDNNLNERRMLARLQIEVVAVTRTADALASIAAARGAGEPFSLVLSDWSRPAEGQDAALLLLRALRAAGQPLPVVIYHGDFDAGSRQHKAALAGAAGALGEAVMPAELIALVQRALGRQPAQR